ncbi:MAG: DUF6488 family protein [Pseudomonadota bacterium]
MKFKTMQFKTIVIGTILSLFSMAIMAGSGHDHGHSHDAPPPITQDIAKVNAGKIVTSLIKKKKLVESWSSIKASSAEKKTFEYKSEWVVTFINDKIADTQKQKLYVFLTLGGRYIAANYTGQ